MDPVQLLQDYGYLVILVWTFLEGETVVIVAGALATQGWLNPWLIALCAFCGSSLSDQFMFSLGRYKGAAVLDYFPSMKKNIGKASKLIQKYENYLILGFRFVYGVRNVTPILLGMGTVSHLKFLSLNLIGAAIWSASFTAGGYYLGEAFLHTVETAGHTVGYVVGGIIIAAIAFYFIRKKIKGNAGDEEESEESIDLPIQPPGQEADAVEANDAPVKEPEEKIKSDE